MKKAFSFFELLVVLFLVVLIYGLFISNFNFNLEKKEQSLGLDNLKTFLLKNYDFEKSLQFVCFSYENDCYIFVDDKIDESNKIDSIFTETPTFYEYSKVLKKLEFDSMKLDNQETKEVLFNFNINSDYKSNEMIIETSNEIVILNAVEKPITLESFTEVKDFFDKKVLEVKDAF